MRRAFFSTVPLVLLVFAAVLYLGVPYEAVAGYPLDPSRSYLSELAAADQPLAPLFRFLDGSAGALVAIAATLLLFASPRWPLRVPIVGLGVFGLGTLADVVFPMACASSLSAACARADAAGTLGIAHQVHTVTSVVALLGAVVAALSLVLLAQWTGIRPVRARILATVGATLLIGVTIAISVIALASTADGALPPGAGYVQRVQTVLLSVFLASFVPLVRAVLKASDAPRRRSARRNGTHRPPAARSSLEFADAPNADASNAPVPAARIARMSRRDRGRAST
ncbi:MULTISPECIES: DUF998 domain-containing protein [Bacteria]|uniref:DUF998 domain-containing protein n=1 Tax=Bacteria TaxID=2 RepID=UPI003C7A8BFD